ncbi:MAG: hypothetical protein IIV87_02720 [Oscillospiraceae bacterium]|nr:hypothetical protein [Oscillospiraceae bacterium]
MDLTTCIKCGRTIADGELFCTQCDLNPLGDEYEAPVREHPAVRPMQAPRKQQPVIKSQPQVQKQPQRSLRAPLGIAVTVAVLALALCAYLLANMSAQRVSLRVKEAELDEKLSRFAELEQTVEDLKRELAEAQQTISERDTEIESLTLDANAAASAISQSQYDMTAQKTELERLQNENKTLSASLEAMEKEYSALKKDAETNAAKASFMDSYVVFVENDGTGLYHRYNCGNFPRRTFWAYSRNLAENHGYDACPNCIK